MLQFFIDAMPAIKAATLAIAFVWLFVAFRYEYGIRDNLYKNMLPFMWIICLALTASNVLIEAPVDVHLQDWSQVVFDALGGCVWLYFARNWYRIWKNEDDDTWKKRRRKIMEKIEVMGHRLVPVPVSG